MYETENYWLATLAAIRKNLTNKHQYLINFKERVVLSPETEYSIKQLEYVIKYGRFPAINFMGAMGSGKSTIAESFANKYGFKFIDADIFHPISNKEKMSKGISLTIDERIPFIEKVQNFLASGTVNNPVVTTCSGLSQAILASLSGADVKDSLTLKNNPWENSLNNIVLQVWVYKPKEQALFELDRAVKNTEFQRRIGQEDHFIRVTYEKSDILDNQYQLLMQAQPKSFQAILLNVMDFFNKKTSKYDNNGILDYLDQYIPTVLFSQ